ncbi:MAG: hypothetical protein AVDCRST_MAG68-4059, partial [uncultured Gemmatimonadetes bacterium]
CSSGSRGKQSAKRTSRWSSGEFIRSGWTTAQPGQRRNHAFAGRTAVSHGGTETQRKEAGRDSSACPPRAN